MSSPIPISAQVRALAETRQNLDLCAGMLASAVKLLCMEKAQPAGALQALEAARGILVQLVADIERTR